jgi:hypothetical protein
VLREYSAKTSINRLVDNAVQKAKEWYPSMTEVVNVDPMMMLKKTSEPEQPDEAVFDEPMMIQLPDGKIGKIRSIKTT